MADGDTGRNLVISLTPLRTMGKKKHETIHRINLAARGNSGNIAARFFTCFLEARSMHDFKEIMPRAHESAWSAVHDPKPGTMLTVFQCLSDFFSTGQLSDDFRWVDAAVNELEKTVVSTPDCLSRLKEAGVVDAGALAMFLFFEGLFFALSNRKESMVMPPQRFGDLLSVNSSFQEDLEEGYCVDMVLQVKGRSREAEQSISGLGESVVVASDRDYLKVHLHTADQDDTKRKMESLGNVVQWSADDIGSQIREFRDRQDAGGFHLVTDAAGSVTREDARRYGFTLLDSYILAGDRSMPETLFPGHELYRVMGNGVRVSTSQASVFERHEHYHRLTQMYDNILYLCVGSAFTGNYGVVMDWKERFDSAGKMTVIDTGAASGRLGLIALATARFAKSAEGFDETVHYARRTVEHCEEYLFLDRLHFLAAGGRMSRTGAFFGDMLNIKPVVSPKAHGVEKAGVLRSKRDQLPFAIELMTGCVPAGTAPLIMLQYTDNRDWVDRTIKSELQNIFPRGTFIMQPLSLTTGVHTGPGTWAVSFLPEYFNDRKKYRDHFIK